MDNPFDLTEKVALITGGASGIGEQLCRVFSMAGARVQVLDLDKGKGESLAMSIRDSGLHAEFYHVDVCDQQAVIEAVDEIVKKHRSLDIAVANAGISQIGRLDQTTPEDLDRIYRVNVKGVYNTMFAAIGPMKKQRSGVLLNLASIASTIGLPDRFGYSMSKGAVLTMTFTTARDYLSYNIRCNCIAPARVHTPFVDDYLAKNYPGRESEMYAKLAATQPIGRMGTPEEIAYLALYLCSDKASFITGSNVPIDGGFITLNT